jgi:hypothetical protein
MGAEVLSWHFPEAVSGGKRHLAIQRASLTSPTDTQRLFLKEAFRSSACRLAFLWMMVCSRRPCSDVCQTIDALETILAWPELVRCHRCIMRRLYLANNEVGARA